MSSVITIIAPPQNKPIRLNPHRQPPETRTSPVRSHQSDSPHRNTGPRLPRWFSQEDEEHQEADGAQEPPATPVGRDELALRRHRLFSELLNVARSAHEHRVRFDPLGPVVAGGEHETVH